LGFDESPRGGLDRRRALYTGFLNRGHHGDAAMDGALDAGFP
jgi:hypothetical protein